MEEQTPEVFCSNEEPRRGLEPLRIDLIENRFEYLSGKALLKEEKVLQHYRHIPMKVDANQMLTGLGTGQGTWGTSNLLLTKLTTVPTPAPKRRDAPVLPANLEKRPRRVAIAEVGLENKFAYALEIERTNQEHSILVLAREDSQRIAADRLQAIMLMCALKRGWVPEEQLPGYRRKTTTHRDLVTISVLESRIWRKIVKVLDSGARQPETDRCFRADGGT